ncbi:malic enzyme-like NAD(P)-binding protein [Candidatus Vidania fulgoroideorum]
MKKESLNYHKKPTPGKISIISKKKINNKNELSLAYSPGVGYVSEEIFKSKNLVYNYTSKGNLVGVLTNGTAVLGLGNIGPLASKPVMEGKSILFKKFANIDSYDLEINENDPKKFVNIVKSLEPTFGGINLEDIKSPDCFYIEKKCKKMKIPVFHDDQHGTAIVVLSALINALKVQKKNISEIKVVVSGAGAAATACLKLMIDFGLDMKNVFVYDILGLLNKERKDICKYRKFLCNEKNISFEKSFEDCDFFLGLSVGNILKDNMLKKMNKKPIIFALANPYPEILPCKVEKVRKDAIIATGRSDFLNQVNNIICFPFIFRGALDIRAKKISKNMKKAAVYAISKLCKIPNKNKIITDIFDKNLIKKVPYKVAKAAYKEKNTLYKKFNFSDYKKKLYENKY